MALKLFISAGEASGDALGASLLAALRRRAPDLEAFGMGGPRMRAQGFRAEKDAREVGVVGFVEIVRHLPRLFRLKDELADLALAQRPDAAVLIDVPDFNIRLAARLKAAGVPVVFYVGPSVWAWRPGRVKDYRPHIDRLLVLFPFEVEVWRRAGVDVECVGHPLLDEVPVPSDSLPEPRTVALLPGSRRGEIARHLGLLLETAGRMVTAGLADRFVLPVAPTLDAQALAAQVAASPVAGRVELVASADGDPAPRRAAVARASLALVASGTATLETALLGVPQVILYRVSWLSYGIYLLLRRVPFLGLVNLIIGRQAVPELLQGHASPEGLLRAARPLLGDGRTQAEEAYRELRGRLGPAGAAERAADAVLSLIRPT